MLFTLWLVLVAEAVAAWPPPRPTQAVLQVRNSTPFPRVAELASGGVPLPRDLGLTDTAGLAVVDAGGTPLPASFRVLARWNAGLDDSTAPIQWLLVRLQVSLDAGSTRDVRLVFDGSVPNPPPSPALQLTHAGSVVAVDTGVARFELGAVPTRVFDRIDGPGGLTLVDGGSVLAQIAGVGAGLTVMRRVQVEHADALAAVVIVEGVYGHSSDGGGAISGGRRIEFAAGSGAVRVREWIDWEGSRCALDQLDCGTQLNARALQRWRIALQPALPGAPTLALRATLAQPASSVSLAPGSEASLRQRLRASRLAPSRFEIALPGQAVTTGTRIDAGVASLSFPAGTLAVALRDMADYEPQALRRAADGSLVLDLADEPVWLGARQGTFAHYAIAALPAGSGNAEATATLWPWLDAPLLVQASAEWIAATQATDEFPVGSLPPGLAGYDTALEALIDRTLALRVERGLQGLMTHGLYPRHWGNPVLSDEIDCGEDPTPADDSDDAYWCAFWTDYHNTTAMAWVAAWRLGRTDALHRLAHPAALRQLHTQMIRCAPGDAYFYCGQLPTGYRGYRSDFNSSHQYVENLMLYYWNTGDRTVLERLQRGAASFRGYLCPARATAPPGPVCAPDAPISDEFAGVNDRVATQFYQIFRFVGLAGDDLSFLDDWRSNLARFLTQNLALVSAGGQELAFTEPSGGGSLSIIDGPGSYTSTQLWMASLYDVNGVHRWQVDSGDLALGVPQLAPSRIQRGWARTLRAASLLAPGDGTPAGVWPNTVRYTFAGARVGGTLTALQPGWAPAPAPDCGNDDCLYLEGKSALTAVLARAADFGADPVMRDAALQQTTFVLSRIQATPLPMGKSAGELFGRLTSAVARLALAASDAERLFADGFER